jgi:hypothetical protein
LETVAKFIDAVFMIIHNFVTASKHLNTQNTLQTTFSLPGHPPLPQSQIPKYPNGSKRLKAQMAQKASQKGKG